MEEYMLPCFTKKYLGIDCPGCGTQRAFVMVCKGEFADAFHMFPAIYTTILFFVLLGLHLVDKSRNYSKLIIVVAIINAIIMFAAFVNKYLFIFL
ncbi:DUF2752 domain-containing protein [Flavobacterium ichthyis]|nr:DUF2752 domain-containing protein [Flavobacterium ichthyis]